MCACPSIKNSWQKCSIKNHNLCEKNTILHNFNILILWSTFNLVSCLKQIIFIGLLLDSWHTLTFYPSCPLCIWFPHNIYIIAKNCTKLYNLWYMKQKEVNKKLSTMHSMEMTPSWLFLHAKYKSIFSFLYWTIYYFVNNLLNNVNIYTWSLIEQHNSYVNDMSFWNKYQRVSMMRCNV